MQDVLKDVSEGVMTLTLNRVDKKNALTQAMYGFIADAMLEAAAAPGVHVLVLQGDPVIFSAGNDIADFLARAPSADAADSDVSRFLRGIAAFPKPLVASVCGPTVGVGTTMLFHCDLVYAGDNAAFSMPFVNLGLCAEAASSLLAPQLMGYHRASRPCSWASP